MRVTFNSSFNEGVLDITLASEHLADAQRQVSSGRRINSPSDDPAGAASAVNDHATMARLDAYTQASDAGSSRLAIADSVLSDVVNQLTSAQATGLAARGSIQTPTQRAALSTALLSIRDALMGDINTKFQGTYLFSGSKSTSAAYATIGGVAVYQGNASAMSIDVGLGRTVKATFDGGQIFQGADPQNVLDAITNLAAAVTVGDDTAIGVGLDALARGLDRAVTAQAQVGNNLNTLDVIRPQIQAARLAAETSASKVEDANLPAAIADISAADTAYRAALGAFATTGRQTLMDYLK